METIGSFNNYCLRYYMIIRCSLAGTDLNRKWRKPSEVIFKYLRF